MNAIMERWIQSCRHELLDRVLIFNQRHLLHALREYEQHYNAHRPHRGMLNAQPLRRLPEPSTDTSIIASLTVRRGEKAVVTLFRKKVKYTHRYRWEPPAELAHSLVLFNDTDAPFTTGPFVATSGSRPLAQDLLKYTPKNGQCELPLTAAVNV